MLARVGANGLYRFDQTCRVVAIASAARLGMRERLPINFLPSAVNEPAACIRPTLEAARRAHIAPSQLIFEFSEQEPVRQPAHTLKIVRHYRSRQILTAFDDFGAAYSGLSLLAQFLPDIVKLDVELIRGIDANTARQKIVRAMVGLCTTLGVKIVPEGIETRNEFSCVRSLGISLLQGYSIARPVLESLPGINPQVWEAK